MCIYSKETFTLPLRGHSDIEGGAVHMKETKESEMRRGAGVNIRIFPDGLESEPSAQTFMLL